jgi:hypothetical protein
MVREVFLLRTLYTALVPVASAPYYALIYANFCFSRQTEQIREHQPNLPTDNPENTKKRFNSKRLQKPKLAVQNVYNPIS